MFLTKTQQYELDGTSETYDPSLPSTNACPYLPGQTVNTLWVPVEQSNRKRSASVNSLREEEFKTMNPADKFVTPRPAPASADTPVPRRIGTAPNRLQHKRSARSLSPGSGWSFSPRKLFGRKASSTSLKAEVDTPPEDDRSVRSGEGSRSRDISPESLRRFFSDDTVSVGAHEEEDWPTIAIPEDIAEENELEDDANFATSAVSENMPFTGLSPPHTRAVSPSPPVTAISLEQSLATLSVTPPSRSAPAPPTRSPPQVPHLAPPAPQSRFSLSDDGFYSPHSPQSPDSNSLPSFYHSDDDEDDVLSANDDEPPSLPGFRATTIGRGSFMRDLDAALSTYSLPQSSAQDGTKLSVIAKPSVGILPGSPALVARDGAGVSMDGNPSLLTSPIPNSGLEDLWNELGWMADVIRGKDA